MIRLIASDLDGTLLQNGAQELPPRTVELIRELTRRGVHFAAASGRQYYSERHIFRDLKDRISYISHNGALCTHQNKIISCTAVPDDLALRIIDEVRKNPDYFLLVSRPEACYVESGNERFYRHMKEVMNFRVKTVKDIRDVELPVIKIAVAAKSENRPLDYLRHLQSLFGDEIRAVTSGTIWIDFITPGCNKGTALRQLMMVLDISPEECMAFGDEYNDIEMLKTAGRSYAMSNGAPGIAGYASCTTDSVEDVLEEVLRELY